MNQRIAAIEARRARLIERAASERAEVAQTLQAWVRPLGFLDRGLEAVRLLTSRPPLVAGAVFVWALLRPQRAFRWAQRAWALWQGYRWLTRKIAI